MPVLFTITIFLSASLLFIVQPMVGKILLPLLGGTPAVWNTCMVFFQAVLLAGYAYAHASTGLLGVQRQSAFHCLILAAPIALLPFGLDAGAAAAELVGVSNPIPWLLTTLAVMVGLPFFVVSSSAPLLQKWFSATGHPSGRDPYFLYAASNAGSMLALLAYPFLLEPTLPLSQQRDLWRWGYVAYAVLAAGCAVTVWLAPATAPSAEAVRTPPPDRPTRLRWIALAFVPSSLMLGTTTYLSTDIAAVPLLWVVPLALYLLSFILVFAGRPILPHSIVLRFLPLGSIALMLAILFEATEPMAVLLPLHLGVMFWAAMACHGELARSRPPADHLTEYFLWMSVGGVLGGLLNGIVAPTLFTRVGIAEYPLALALASFWLPDRPRPADLADIPEPQGLGRYTFPLLLGAFAAATALVLWIPAVEHGLTERVASLMASRQGQPDEVEQFYPKARHGFAAIVFGVPLTLAYLLGDSPRRFSVALLSVWAASYLFVGSQGKRLVNERNFYGVIRVNVEPDTGWHKLVHGTTVHGRQRWKNGRAEAVALAYYHSAGPVGQVFRELIDPKPGPVAVAVCGLGAGGLAAYARPGQTWTFYEIDPAVIRIAQNPALFTFLRDKFPDRENLTIELGDARLRIGTAPDGRFGIIVMDVFSSDSIPTHLLNSEAIELYLKKLTPDGVLVFHISNRYLDLSPVLAKLAESFGLHAIIWSDLAAPTAEEKAEGKLPSVWVVMARSREALKPLLNDPTKWEPLPPPPPGTAVWTDDYSNLLGVLRLR